MKILHWCTKINIYFRKLEYCEKCLRASTFLIWHCADIIYSTYLLYGRVKDLQTHSYKNRINLSRNSLLNRTDNWSYRTIKFYVIFYPNNKMHIFFLCQRSQVRPIRFVYQRFSQSIKTSYIIYMSDNANGLPDLVNWNWISYEQTWNENMEHGL